jgi:hypothetical protein
MQKRKVFVRRVPDNATEAELSIFFENITGKGGIDRI